MRCKVLIRLWVCVVFGLALGGCTVPHAIDRDSFMQPAHTRPPALRGFPADVKVIATPALIDYQLTLADRGLYLSNINDIKPIDPTLCPINIVGHRGYFRAPENSVQGIRHGLLAGNDAIELDLIQLSDGNWVIHHDLTLGRTTGTDDGKAYAVPRLNSRDWTRVRVRNPRTLALEPDQAAPFLADALNEIQRFAAPHQHVNFEIKSRPSTQALQHLDRQIRARLGGGYYYSSMSLETLRAVRAINPHVYLGWIVPPEPTSISVLKQHGKSSPGYRKFQADFERVLEAGRRYSDLARLEWSNDKLLDQLHAALGPASGLHVDVRRLEQKPALISKAHARGLQVYSYSINGHAYHLNTLKQLDKALPDGVIADASPYRLCQQLFDLFHPRQHHQPVSALGKMVSMLPADADLERLSDQTSHVANRLYLALDGNVRPLKRSVSHSALQAPIHPPSTTPGQPGKIRDEMLPIEPERPILIRLDRGER